MVYRLGAAVSPSIRVLVVWRLSHKQIPPDEASLTLRKVRSPPMGGASERYGLPRRLHPHPVSHGPVGHRVSAREEMDLPVAGRLAGRWSDQSSATRVTSGSDSRAQTPGCQGLIPVAVRVPSGWRISSVAGTSPRSANVYRRVAGWLSRAARSRFAERRHSDRRRARRRAEGWPDRGPDR